MIRFSLEPHHEKLALDGTFPPTLKRHPLYHQARTYQALKSQSAVLNTYNTGTGKTIASLLYLLDLDTMNRASKRTNNNVLLIAPTNALIGQHTEDVRAFVEENDLNYHVREARAEDIAQIKGTSRSGEILSRLIQNYTAFEDTYTARKPLILVTNPDIYYYALYFQYNPHDQRNLFETFIRRFEYIIVDEFHYYDNKQLTSFLFAFMIFRQWGYLDEGVRVCLLSATPRENVMQYMHAIFQDQLAVITSDTEPSESQQCETIPALAPLEVSVQSGALRDWLTTSQDTLKDWLAHGKDGAIISNSLARINEAYSVLPRSGNIARITGPEPPEARSSATAKQLILATPTVDIGYNFHKRDKSRQNIDFVICEARYQDDLIQRIGRAGRVLGKKEVATPSTAVILLSEVACAAFTALDGKTLTRTDFASWLNTNEQLQPKHQLEAYLRHYAPLELAYPLYQLGKIFLEEDQSILDELYQELCNLLGVASPKSRMTLASRFRKMEKQQHWFNAAKQSPRTPPPETAKMLADFFYWRDQTIGYQEPNELQEHVNRVWRNRDWREELTSYVQSQIALQKALFQFRDSFEGITCQIYDPNNLFSSQTTAIYDLFHFLRNYRFDLITPAQFKKLSGTEAADKADFCLHLHNQLETRRQLDFMLSTPLPENEFHQRWTGLPVALKGLQPILRESAGNPVAGGIPLQLSDAVADLLVTCLILLPDDLRAIRSRFYGTELIPWRLSVLFESDGQTQPDYSLFVGTSAFFAHAELKAYLARKDRLRDEAIIV